MVRTRGTHQRLSSQVVGPSSSHRAVARQNVDGEQERRQQESVVPTTEYQKLANQIERMMELVVGQKRQIDYLMEKEKGKDVQERTDTSNIKKRRASEDKDDEVTQTSERVKRLRKGRRREEQDKNQHSHLNDRVSQGDDLDDPVRKPVDPILERLKLVERNMRRMSLKDTKVSMDEDFKDVLRSPFTAWVERAKLPRNFQIPRFEMYNGSTDPLEHLSHYRTTIIPMNLPVEDADGVMCKVFPSNLWGASLTWFNHLKSDSINCFADLGNQLLVQFLSSRRAQLNSDDLYSVRQERGEMIRNYVERIMKMRVEIVDCEENIAISAFQKGLHVDGDLYVALTTEKPRTLEKALKRARGYITLEEEREYQRREQGKGKSKVSIERASVDQTTKRNRDEKRHTERVDRVEMLGR